MSCHFHIRISIELSSRNYARMNPENNGWPLLKKKHRNKENWTKIQYNVTGALYVRIETVCYSCSSRKLYKTVFMQLSSKWIICCHTKLETFVHCLCPKNRIPKAQGRHFDAENEENATEQYGSESMRISIEDKTKCGWRMRSMRSMRSRPAQKFCIEIYQRKTCNAYIRMNLVSGKQCL